MKFEEINKKYTKIVAEYITNGYTINAGTMNGSQGEIARIDLTNGNEVVRVLICNKTEYDEIRGYDTCQLIVGKCTDNVRINSDSPRNIIWNDKLEIIICEKFYEVYENIETGAEYGTKEEAEIARKKRGQRYGNRPCNRIDLTDKYLEIGKKIIKRVWGKSRVNNADIKVFRQNDNYYVSYKYETYRIH